MEVLAVDLSDPTGLSSHRGRADRRPRDQRRPHPRPDRRCAGHGCPRFRWARPEVSLATFDLSPEVLEAIVDGKMLFAIDQQQYLQGYLPIVLLTLYEDRT